MDDFDRDGVVELLEYAFGGDPKTPDAANLPAAVNEGGYLTVTLTKRPGVTYIVETAPGLQPASWSYIDTSLAPGQAAKMFFKIQLEPQP